MEFRKIFDTIPEQFDKYTTDGLHFNDEGHGVLAEKLMAFIEAM